MLQAIALSKNFGGLRAVDGVSFNLPPGCLAGLIGPNGAGKTTLFNLLAGSLKPSGGQLLFAGRPIDGLPPHAIFAAGIARTFQIPRPFAAMTVLENMMVAGTARRASASGATGYRPPRSPARSGRCATRRWSGSPSSGSRGSPARRPACCRAASASCSSSAAC